MTAQKTLPSATLPYRGFLLEVHMPTNTLRIVDGATQEDFTAALSHGRALTCTGADVRDAMHLVDRELAIRAVLAPAA